jgi:hypothetical protein
VAERGIPFLGLCRLMGKEGWWIVIDVRVYRSRIMGIGLYKRIRGNMDS